MIRAWLDSDAPFFVLTLGLLAAYEGFVNWGVTGAALTYFGWIILWIGIFWLFWIGERNG